MHHLSFPSAFLSLFLKMHLHHELWRKMEEVTLISFPTSVHKFQTGSFLTRCCPFLCTSQYSGMLPIVLPQSRKPLQSWGDFLSIDRQLLFPLFEPHAAQWRRISVSVGDRSEAWWNYRPCKYGSIAWVRDHHSYEWNSFACLLT